MIMSCTCVTCNKAQESHVVSPKPQEWVAGWMVMFVGSGFTTFCCHNLTILLFLLRGASLPSSCSPPYWFCVCGCPISHSEHAKLHVFLAALSISDFDVSLPLSSTVFTRAQLFFLPFTSFYHPCIVFLLTARFLPAYLDASDKGA